MTVVASLPRDDVGGPERESDALAKCHVLMRSSSNFRGGVTFGV
jgi:hypothetical protein